MTHLLDTNICSAHMRRPGGLAHRFFQYAGGIATSTVVLAELYSGAYKHPSPSRLLALIADLHQEESCPRKKRKRTKRRAWGIRNRSSQPFVIALACENMQSSTVQVNSGRTSSGIVADSCTDEVDRTLKQIRRYRQWTI